MSGESPAIFTACRLACTMSRDAATRRPRRTRSPPSPVSSSSGWKSRTACSTGMGTKSCTWKASDFFSSSAGIHGRSTWRTMTFWFATPMTTFLLLNLVWLQSCLMAAPTASGSITSPSRTAPSGRATCPNFSRVT